MKSYIVIWNVKRGEAQVRSGYSVVLGKDKWEARRNIRNQVFLQRGDRMTVERVQSSTSK
jgi:hypothetical protein